MLQWMDTYCSAARCLSSRLKVTCSPPCFSSRCCWGCNIWPQSTHGSGHPLFCKLPGEPVMRGHLSALEPGTKGAVLSSHWRPGLTECSDIKVWMCEAQCSRVPPCFKDRACLSSYFFFSLNPPLWGTMLFPVPPHTSAEAAAPSSCSRCLESMARLGGEGASSICQLTVGCAGTSIILPSLVCSPQRPCHVCAKPGCRHAAHSQRREEPAHSQRVHRVCHQPLSVCLLPHSRLWHVLWCPESTVTSLLSVHSSQSPFGW